jgi:hypothetical protein
MCRFSEIAIFAYIDQLFIALAFRVFLSAVAGNKLVMR